MILLFPQSVSRNRLRCISTVWLLAYHDMAVVIMAYFEIFEPRRLTACFDTELYSRRSTTNKPQLCALKPRQIFEQPRLHILLIKASDLNVWIAQMSALPKEAWALRDNSQERTVAE